MSTSPPGKLDYKASARRDEAFTFRQAALAILAIVALIAFLFVMLHLFPQGG